EFIEKDVHGFFQALAEGEPVTSEDGFLGHGQNGAGVRGDARNEFVDRGVELGFGDETGDQAEFEGTLGSNRFAGQNDFERALWSDEEREDGGSQRREHADGDFGLREAGFGRGDDEIAEGSQFCAAADGRSVYNAKDGLADLQHCGERSVERFQHLVDALRGVFADIDAAAEDFAGGIDGDELDVVALAGENDAVGNFAEHAFVEEVVIRPVEGEAGDTVADAKFYEFKTLWFATYGSRCKFLGANRFNHDGLLNRSCAAKAEENWAKSMLAQHPRLASCASGGGAQTVAAEGAGATLRRN